MSEKIPITKPFLPPKEDYKNLVNDIWNRNWLTNNGPLVKQLETGLKNYLGVPYLDFVSNGTVALQIAIKVLGLEEEIITTPFSYVATTSSIVWEDCTPIFVDIDPNTLNIDPDLIEEAITDKTTCILATHVYGNPCNIEAISRIADRYDLKIIYDAAHCFGTKYKDKSIYSYGDISTASFHATKLYHTVEGGAIITGESEMSKKISRMKNFGHAGPGNFEGVGINGKNSEFHAAMGICNLKYIESILANRKAQWLEYDKLLSGMNHLNRIALNPDSEYNYAYFPVIFNSEDRLLKTVERMNQNNIYPRRYFYPSLNSLDYVHSVELPIADSISKRVLCLPLYSGMDDSYLTKIVNMLDAN